MKKKRRPSPLQRLQILHYDAGYDIIYLRHSGVETKGALSRSGVRSSEALRRPELAGLAGSGAGGRLRRSRTQFAIQKIERNETTMKKKISLKEQLNTK